MRLRSSLSLASSLFLAMSAGALFAPAAPAAPAVTSGRDLVAIKAGTIFLVENDQVLEGGATILVQGSRILAVGANVDVPADARVVDYGPQAVIVPGLVAPYSNYASGRAGTRTASPGLRGIDGFDFYETFAAGLAGGVTSAYVTPAQGRLIAGVGGLVKLAGDDAESRILNPRAAIHGAIDASARRTRGFWEPPLPATSDVGIGFPEPQLPRTTSGALVALQELLAVARTRDASSPYGPYAGTELAELIQAGVPWRLGAMQEDEIRGVLRFASENNVPVILDKAGEANLLVDEIAASGVAVIFHVPYVPNSRARDYGKDRDAVWPNYAVPAALVARGVKVAIASELPHDLLFSAALASRGGLSEAQALRAITLTPAELFGAADRVGSLRVGKDADFVVLNGRPLDAGAGVLDTWIGGESRWDVEASGSSDESAALRGGAAGRRGAAAAVAAAPTAPTVPTVIVVDELHIGDGRVLRPGEILLSEGRIAEVGASVGRPRGAQVVHGHAAIPGMIDALGHLGLEGSSKVPGADFLLQEIVAPGDRVDRRVALAGITTVILSPRKSSKEGAPMMAYKPAAAAFERQIVGDPVALRLQWTEKNRLESGTQIEKLLTKAAEYRQKWQEYEKALAEWTPPPATADTEEEAEPEAEKGEGDEKEEAAEKDDEKPKKKKKKKKKKKDEPEELEPDPITGVWEASLERAPRPEPLPFKMRIELEPREGSGRVWGNLRSLAVAHTLVAVEGWFDREERTLELNGLGDQGWVSVAAKLEEGKLVGTIGVSGRDLALSAERVSREFVVAGRTRRLPEEEEEKKAREPKGKPKAPKLDKDLEPLRAAMDGRATLVVEVEREDEILGCVELFEKFGVLPVLYGATDSHYVKERLRGRVAGILLAPQVLSYDPKRGTDYRTPYADLQAAGIPVGFHSQAEEGAVDLPIRASYAVANGMSRAGALRALSSDVAQMFAIEQRVGRLEAGLDADVLLLDGPPLDPRTSVVRAWVNGVEILADEEGR